MSTVDRHLKWDRYQSQIEDLAKLEYNYDERIYHDSKDKSGWNIDKYQAVLACEPPGEPMPNGAFAAVKNSILLYQFPDPNLIRAFFDPEGELSGRNMLLIANFMGIKFHFGVRVTAVIDEVRHNDKGAALKVWGYSYRTLRGHFEVGEIRFEVSKNMMTGEVAFGVNAYSKADRIPNFFYRMGFKIFGRTLQRYFARSNVKRLQTLAKASLLRA